MQKAASFIQGDGQVAGNTLLLVLLSGGKAVYAPGAWSFFASVFVSFLESVCQCWCLLLLFLISPD